LWDFSLKGQDMKRGLNSLLIAMFAILFLATNASYGAFILSITDDGTDLTMKATGSYDLTGIGSAGGLQLGVNAAVAPAISGGLYGWESEPNTKYVPVAFSGNLTGTSNALTADFVSTTTPFNLNIGNNAIYLPTTASLTGTFDNIAIFEGVTLASLGMVAGETINVTWQGDSAIITTVNTPEPATATLALLGLGGLMMRRRRDA
jgi:MYXO-CTERM domain-containing protein